MRLIPAQFGTTKWHIVGVNGDGRDAHVSLQSSIAFDDRDAALAYIEIMEKETTPDAPQSAPEPEQEPTPDAPADNPAEAEPDADEPEPVETPTPETPAEPVVKGVDMGAPNGDSTAIAIYQAGNAAPVWEGVVSKVTGGVTDKRPLSVVERIRKGLQGLGIVAPDYTIGDVMEHTGIKALGDGLWIGAFSNNFRDRDGEIITASALDGMIERMRADIIPYPELWHAHKWYTKHGAAFFAARAGNIVYAVGKFDKTRLGAMMETHYNSKPGEYAMSHGFTFPEWGYDPIHKTYSVINTFEISTLPPEMAANLYTPFQALGEVTKMSLSVDERAQLEKTLGPKITAEIAAQHKTLEKASEQVKQYIGAEYKEFTRIPVATDAAPVTAPTATAAPVETPAAATDAGADAKAEVDTDALGVLLNDLMGAQVETMNLVTAMAERMNQQDGLLREMATQLGYEDVPASESPETEVTAEAAASDPDTAKTLADAQAAIGKKRSAVDSQYADVPALASMFDAPQ